MQIDMKVILENIKELVQVEEKARTWVAGTEMKELKVLRDAFLVIGIDCAVTEVAVDAIEVKRAELGCVTGDGLSCEPRFW